MTAFSTIVLAVVLFLLFVYVYKAKDESVWVTSTLDGQRYLMRRGAGKNPEYLIESANVLAEINRRTESLINHLERNPQSHTAQRHVISQLRKNYSPSILSEAANDTRYTTFTVDKKDMHICLRTRDQDERLYNINLLMYVVLHELAHLCNYDPSGTPIQGHGQEFRSVFKLLVTEAIRIGAYEYVDYTKRPEEYCGIVVTTNILPSKPNVK